MGNFLFRKVRNETHLSADHAMIRNLVLGRILGLLVVRTNVVDTTMRSAADMRDLVQDLTLTKNAGQATPSHLADDMYTKPNNPQLYINTQLINQALTTFSTLIQLYF